MPFDIADFQIPAEAKEAEPFSLEALIAWLRTKPADEAYPFLDGGGHCLIGQYLISTTGKMWQAHRCQSWMNVPENFRTVAAEDGFCRCGTNYGYTYGAALSRALALQSRAPETGGGR